MGQQTRRDFLGKALLAGAGVALVGSDNLLGTDLRADSAIVLEDEPDPGFVAGVVVGVGETPAEYVVLDADKNPRTLSLGSLSSVWKQGRWNSTPLGVGDCLLLTRATPTLRGAP